MLENLPTLAQLLKVLQHVPYLASKNLYRVAQYFLHMEPAKAQQFCKAVLEAKEKLVKCHVCFVWKEKERDCLFCTSKKKRSNRCMCGRIMARAISY